MVNKISDESMKSHDNLQRCLISAEVPVNPEGPEKKSKVSTFQSLRGQKKTFGFARLSNINTHTRKQWLRS